MCHDQGSHDLTATYEEENRFLYILFSEELPFFLKPQDIKFLNKDVAICMREWHKRRRKKYIQLPCWVKKMVKRWLKKQAKMLKMAKLSIVLYNDHITSHWPSTPGPKVLVPISMAPVIDGPHGC